MEDMEATLASRQDEINKYTELFEKSNEELSEMTARYQQVDEVKHPSLYILRNLLIIC